MRGTANTFMTLKLMDVVTDLSTEGKSIQAFRCAMGTAIGWHIDQAGSEFWDQQDQAGKSSKKNDNGGPTVGEVPRTVVEALEQSHPNQSADAALAPFLPDLPLFGLFWARPPALHPFLLGGKFGHVGRYLSSPPLHQVRAKPERMHKISSLVAADLCVVSYSVFDAQSKRSGESPGKIGSKKKERARRRSTQGSMILPPGRGDPSSGCASNSEGDKAGVGKGRRRYLNVKGQEIVFGIRPGLYANMVEFLQEAKAYQRLEKDLARLSKALQRLRGELLPNDASAQSFAPGQADVAGWQPPIMSLVGKDVRESQKICYFLCQLCFDSRIVIT